MYSYSTTNKMPYMVILFLVLLLSNYGLSQVPIGLQEAIGMAQQQNRSILRANQSIAVNKASYEQSKGHFLPYFGANLTDVVSNNPLNVFGFKLLHEEVRQEDFNPVLLNAPNVTNHFNLTINAMMPLYNPEAKAEQEAVTHQIKMSESMSLRTREGIEMEVIQSYYGLLLSQNAVTVLKGTYAAAQSNYNVVENYYNQGLMLKSDLLEMQVMVHQSELALQSAQMNVENAQSQFRYVLGVADQTDYLPIDALSAVATLDISEGDLSPHRADFEAMQHGINAMHSMVTATDKSFLPKVKAFAGFEFNDGIPFAMRANNFQVGVTVGWDIYKGNMRQTTINKTKAEIAEKQLELEENKAKAELEILLTRRAIDHIKSQIQLHDLAISQTEEALKIRKNRFEQGLEKSNEIINAETQLTQKRLERLQALYEMNVKHAYLKFLLK